MCRTDEVLLLGFGKEIESKGGTIKTIGGSLSRGVLGKVGKPFSTQNDLSVVFTLILLLRWCMRLYDLYTYTRLPFGMLELIGVVPGNELP